MAPTPYKQTGVYVVAFRDTRFQDQGLVEFWGFDPQLDTGDQPFNDKGYKVFLNQGLSMRLPVERVRVRGKEFSLDESCKLVSGQDAVILRFFVTIEGWIMAKVRVGNLRYDYLCEDLVKLALMKRCPDCDHGWIADEKGWKTSCSTCKGLGHIPVPEKPTTPPTAMPEQKPGLVQKVKNWWSQRFTNVNHGTPA